MSLILPSEQVPLLIDITRQVVRKGEVFTIPGDVIDTVNFSAAAKVINHNRPGAAFSKMNKWLLLQGDDYLQLIND